MTYRVEYNGEDIEVTTLEAALDSAKNAIAADIGPISGWTVEHDDTINDWFVQGVLDGSPVGPTAVVSGPEPTAPPYPRDLGVVVGPKADEARIRPTTTPRSRRVEAVSFAGGTPAEAFGQAVAWLAGRPGADVSDVAWRPTAHGGELRIYYQT
jgi:hypothetical protein